MKKFLLLLLIFLANLTLYSQSLSVFNIDQSTFPIIKANFFAIDNIGNQITNLSSSDFEIKENGTIRNVTLVSCPPQKPIIALS